MTGTSVYDFEPDASVPADVRRAALRASEVLRCIGIPPRGPDGEHQVLLAFAMPDRVMVEILSFAKALKELECPVVQGYLRRAAEQMTAAPLAVVLLAIGAEGNFWCAPVGTLTGPAPLESA